MKTRVPAVSTAVVASEAVTAVLMHLTKSLAYGRYAVLSFGDFLRGLTA